MMGVSDTEELGWVGLISQWSRSADGFKTPNEKVLHGVGYAGNAGYTLH